MINMIIPFNLIRIKVKKACPEVKDIEKVEV